MCAQPMVASRLANQWIFPTHQLNPANPKSPREMTIPYMWSGLINCRLLAAPMFFTQSPTTVLSHGLSTKTLATHLEASAAILVLVQALTVVSTLPGPTPALEMKARIY